MSKHHTRSEVITALGETTTLDAAADLLGVHDSAVIVKRMKREQIKRLKTREGLIILEVKQ